MNKIRPHRNTANTKIKRHAMHNAILKTTGILFLALIAMMMVNASSAFAIGFPQCEDPKVEARIIKDFNWAERKTWQRGIQLMQLSKMHEHRTVNHEGSVVTRRYCMAKAHLSNGKHRSIYYMINDRGGFAGIWWRVTHCVIGLDPWRNHDGHCRAIR